MCLCNEARVLLFVPSVKRLRLKIGHKKPTVHLCACYPFDNGTIMKELHAVISHVGRLRYRLLYLDQVLLEHVLAQPPVMVRCRRQNKTMHMTIQIFSHD